MDTSEEANDGRSNGALFSGIAGDSMQRVVLCSDRCALKVKASSIDPDFGTHNSVHPSTGKPLAGKLA